MRGDALASGSKSANFPQGTDAPPKPKGVKVCRACKCGGTFWDEAEYAEHIKTCPDAQ